MNKIAEKIIGKIKNEHIKPLPKWRFILKQALVWFAFIFSVSLGSMAFAVIIYAFFETDFDIFSYQPVSDFTLLLKMLPLFWLILLVLFVFFAIYGLKHTKKGYRYSLLKVLALSIGLSIFLGTGFYLTEGADELEMVFSERMPFYRGIHENRMERWEMVEDGFLGGVILEDDGDFLMLEDLKNDQWQVFIFDADIHPEVEIIVGEKIRVIGEPEEGNIFNAKVVLPWERKGFPFMPPPPRKLNSGSNANSNNSPPDNNSDDNLGSV